MKVPFNILYIEVDKLYNKDVGQDIETINKHIEFIASFIKSCGWTEEEFIEEMIKDKEKN